MKRIKEIIKEIKNRDQEWEKHQKLEDIEDEGLEGLMNELIGEVRELLKKDEGVNLEEIKKAIDNNGMYDSLIEISLRTLRHYNAWRIVRDLEQKDKDMVQILFQNVMDKYVLRLEYEFQDTHSTYGVSDSEVFYEMLSSYDTLITYYIQRHFSRKAVVGDVREETEITNDSAEIFADLYERNYKELQLNIILDGLRKLGGKQ